MTSGRPPDAAVFPRAGTLVPPAVASVCSLPVTLVFVGTVLLSVVLRWRCVRTGSVGPGRPAPTGAAEKSPSAGHGKPLSRQGAGDDPLRARRQASAGGGPDPVRDAVPSLDRGSVDPR